MAPRNVGVRFFARFVVVFVVFLAAWSLVAGAYAAFFRGVGGSVAATGRDWTVWYSQSTGQDAHHDTEVLFLNRKANLRGSFSLSSKRMAYMPTAFLAALIVATPIAWKRRSLALLWGMLWVHAYIAIRLLLIPATYFAKEGEESGRTLLARLDWVLSGSSAGWTIVPLVIWLLVTFRYDDRVTLLKRIASHAKQ